MAKVLVVAFVTFELLKYTSIALLDESTSKVETPSESSE